MVWLPTQVRDEVLPGVGHDDERAIAGAFDDGWLLAQDEAPDASELPDLDEGEAARIRLAPAQAEPCLVERASTALTRERGLPVAGTSAVSGVARQRGLIPSAPQVFAKLHAADYRISPAVTKTLKMTGHPARREPPYLPG